MTCDALGEKSLSLTAKFKLTVTRNPEAPGRTGLHQYNGAVSDSYCYSTARAVNHFEGSTNGSG
ncbi:hypothetical protein Terro_3087 [Terriglobus roseus DSM 18391]|uniref:Uncharacterized protein n=1 Tax=Terriglobus roseus (strain DSM 18391 / NRRL B-41598 / KBS 63) TaxID=926566 RepID=I3ZJA0_TERRK|nr:hypothetical protein [Terriglobus roseus]AFL89318.1 hypothetical protein Terro_3087 [Terriglobus roseus DSM 18391]